MGMGTTAVAGLGLCLGTPQGHFPPRVGIELLLETATEGWVLTLSCTLGTFWGSIGP